jgi:hypothetical protein
MTGITDTESLERRKLLRGSIKLMISIGVLFLLVPFFRSIPWPEASIPENSTQVPNDKLVAGEAFFVTLQDGSSVYVTRLDNAVRSRLLAFSEDHFWYPSAPGLLSRDYVAVQSVSTQDEPVRWLPPNGAWPGGFVAPGGAAWDLAGRALKPYPGHPTGHTAKIANLMPSPWQQHGDTVLLIPLPPLPPVTESSE